MMNKETNFDSKRIHTENIKNRFLVIFFVENSILLIIYRTLST